MAVVNPDPKVAERVALIAGPKHKFRPILASVGEVVWNDL